MTPQHFMEILTTVCMTKKVNEAFVADVLGVAQSTITRWKAEGVPPARALRVGIKLRNFVMFNMATDWT